MQKFKYINCFHTYECLQNTTVTYDIGSRVIYFFSFDFVEISIKYPRTNITQNSIAFIP
jgi:hypothetical protein